ncbi:MAG: DUF6328 family protein [Nocardioidaceae bacterium]
MSGNGSPAPAGQPGRQETAAERADRNYDDLLQELRVAQTGVQILFAFLLTMAFQSRFDDIDRFERATYVVALLLCAAATAMLIGPVALHRRIFARGQKEDLVRFGALMARVGILLLFLAITASLLLVLHVVLGRTWALVLAGAAAAVFVSVWYVVPALVARRAD